MNDREPGRPWQQSYEDLDALLAHSPPGQANHFRCRRPREERPPSPPKNCPCAGSRLQVLRALQGERQQSWA